MQLSFLNEPHHGPIVNVAMVPQRSPFRYPGGKTWLVPRIREWLASLPTAPTEFIEPFVGGGIVSLTVAFERLAQHITMVELDDQVAAVWQTILNGDGLWLAERIATFDLTAESVLVALTAAPSALQEQAFQTILKNRVNRGGILAPGAGKVKYGENGKGLKSRWYPQTLKRDCCCARSGSNGYYCRLPCRINRDSPGARRECNSDRSSATDTDARNVFDGAPGASPFRCTCGSAKVERRRDAD